LETMASSEEAQAEIDSFQRLQASIVAVQGQIDSTKAKLDAEHKRKEKFDLEQTELEREKEKFEQELKQVLADLKHQEKKSTRTVSFSLLRSANTDEIVILLRYGKIYRLTNSSDPGDINTTDIKVNRGLFKTSYEPEKAAGSRVTSESLERLSEFIGTFPPSQYHITVAVWDDSYAEFNKVRNELVRKGLKYRTILCTDDTELSFGTVTDSLVQ
jgi:hypothetical protein